MDVDKVRPLLVYIQNVNLLYQFLSPIKHLAKKKDHGAITFQLAEKCIVIGHTKEGGVQGNVNKGVGTITSYLKENGY